VLIINSNNYEEEGDGEELFKVEDEDVTVEDGDRVD